MILVHGLVASKTRGLCQLIRSCVRISTVSCLIAVGMSAVMARRQALTLREPFRL